ncbi:MAG: 16S rRNA (guanine(966)-N(2))-methyltransferase RsmD [Actinomycetota bacterium]|nr:16S rRNA (guanine(966)-N(2))-methyltransferase RsmD [Actinomycetota bacterium]MDA8293609.1 16S rRNA (guanine(966)-N(2))-methyltransferase RsmD [Actinomycetota bacterium]
MRVIGGELRGRKLVAPPLTDLRPTSDRVREAVFDILFSLGGVEGARAADVFAGSGALGIEALSRGAAEVTFVERDPAAVTGLRRNLASVGLVDAERSGRAHVVRADATGWARGTATHYDVVLCDPPYAFTAWAPLLEALSADVAVLESAEEPELPAGWAALRSRRYGGTLVTVVTSDRAPVPARSVVARSAPTRSASQQPAPAHSVPGKGTW